MGKKKFFITAGVIILFLAIYLGITLISDVRYFEYESLREKAVQNNDITSIIKIFKKSSFNIQKRAINDLETVLNKISPDYEKYREGMSFLCEFIKDKNSPFKDNTSEIVYRLNIKNIIKRCDIKSLIEHYEESHSNEHYRPKMNLIRFSAEGLREAFWGKTPGEVMASLNNSGMVVKIIGEELIDSTYVTPETNEKILERNLKNRMKTFWTQIDELKERQFLKQVKRGQGYKEKWDVYIIDWKDKLVTAHIFLTGGLPPQTTTIPLDYQGIKKVYGASPSEESIDEWIRSLPEK